MHIFRLVSALFVWALVTAPAFAQRPGLQPGGQPAPTSFAAADELWKDTSTSLSRLMDGRECLDPAALNMIGLADRAIAQLADFLRTRPVSGFMSDAEYAPIRSLDLKIGQLRGMVTGLKSKPPCQPRETAAPAAPATPAPPAPPAPKAPSVLHLPPGATSVSAPRTSKKPPPDIETIREAFHLSKCLTDDEVRKVDQLSLEIITLNSKLEFLREARDYIDSHKALSDFAREKLDPLNPSDVEDQKFLEAAEAFINRNANMIYANPRIIQETEELLEKKNKEYDAFKDRKCPEDQRTGMLGPQFGLQGTETFACLATTERLADTNDETNSLKDCKTSGLGVGAVGSYNFMLPGSNVIVGPFVSFDYLNARVDHTLAGGSSLGTTANFAGTAGVKIGPQVNPELWLYGVAGVSVLVETMNVNFLPLASSSHATVPGATIGAGINWHPKFLKAFGRPVSLFLEYQHTWWEAANFNTPAASPAFNYSFRRDDGMLKFGFTVPLSPPPAAPLPRPIITK